VLVDEVGGRDGVAVLVVAGLDLATEDAGELDVLGGVVGVDVVQHRQVGDGVHRFRPP
jgi:hypothetical protein